MIKEKKWYTAQVGYVTPKRKLHQVAHIHIDASNMVEANKIAVDRFKKLGYSVKDVKIKQGMNSW